MLQNSSQIPQHQQLPFCHNWRYFTLSMQVCEFRRTFSLQCFQHLCEFCSLTWLTDVYNPHRNRSTTHCFSKHWYVEPEGWTDCYLMFTRVLVLLITKKSTTAIHLLFKQGDKHVSTDCQRVRVDICFRGFNICIQLFWNFSVSSCPYFWGYI